MPYHLSTTDYPLDYKEACFYAWYKAGRPMRDFLRLLPVSPDGRKPNLLTVRKWMDGGDGFQNWHEHADDLDLEVSKRLDKEAIEERAKLVKKLAQEGEEMKEAGLKFLKGEDPFKDNPSAAVRAVIAGSDMQFKYTGMAASLLMISQMDDKQLTKEALRLLGKNENIDVIEADIEDVPSKENDDSSPEDD